MDDRIVSMSEWRVNEDLSLATMTPNEATQRRQLMIQFIRDSMKEGRDYGVISGTEQLTLWKPGAEKLCTFFGYSFRLIPVESVMDWTGKDHDGEPFFFFRHRCELRHGAVLIGDSEGSCNSWEKKYRYRDGKRKCPKCGKETVYKSKPRDGDPPNKPMGYYCWAKMGGCGAKFTENDVSITGQQVGQVRNDGIFDQVNTIQKMSEKRALVGTTVIACNASEFFCIDWDEEGVFEDLNDTRPVITRDDLPETKEEIIENGKAASASLRGDQGDIGPNWDAYPSNPATSKTITDRTATEPALTPVPTTTTSQPTTNGKSATLRYQPFVAWANEWVRSDARAAEYAKEHDADEEAIAHMYHILRQVGKLGFSEVTEANVEQIKAALQKHIEATA